MTGTCTGDAARSFQAGGVDQGQRSYRIHCQQKSSGFKKITVSRLFETITLHIEKYNLF